VIQLVYVIFKVKSDDAAKINKIIKEDIVSRQSIITRDSSSLNLKGDFLFLKIEGSEAGIKKAEEIAGKLELEKLKSKEAEDINKKIAEQEDSAASGMGMIFD
jgi:hypothetical protein